MAAGKPEEPEETVPPIEIRFVPIVMGAHAGETGTVTPAMLAELRAQLRRERGV